MELSRMVVSEMASAQNVNHQALENLDQQFAQKSARLTFNDLHLFLKKNILNMFNTAEKLITAIESNDINEVQNLLSAKNISPHNLLCQWVGGSYCTTPLDYVCKQSTGNMMCLILKHISYERRTILGELKNGSSYAPFHYTALNGNAEILQMIIEMKIIDINLKTKNNQTVLHLASRFGHDNIVKILLDNTQIEIDAIDYTGQTPLYLAACYGHLQIVKYLLGHGANINSKSQYGLTPLLGAACKGKIEVVLELLDYGADATTHDKDSDTALHFLRRKCSPALLSKLLQGGALLGAPNKLGITPLNGLQPNVLQKVLDDSITSEEIPENEKGLHKYMKDDNKLKFKNPFTTAEHLSNQSADLKNFVAISKSKKHEHLVFHPIFRALIDMKWQVVQRLYVFRLLLFLTFVIYISCYVFFENIPNKSDKNDTRVEESGPTQNDMPKEMYVFGLSSLWILLIILLSFRFLETVFRWKYNFYRAAHWLEFFVLLVTACYLIYPLQNLVPFILLLAWTQAFLHVSRYPKVSPLFYIFCDICKNFIKFFFFSVLLLIGFLLSFHFLLRKKQNTLRLRFNEDPWAFNNLSSSALKLAAMTLGEVSFEEFMKHEDKYLMWGPLLAIFMFFICFVLYNMINGLAVSDTQNLRKRAEFATLVAQGEMVLSLEEQINEMCWAKLLLKSSIFTVPKISLFYILPSTGQCIEASPDPCIIGQYVNLETVDNVSVLIENMASLPELVDINNLQSHLEMLKNKIRKISIQEQTIIE